MSISFQEGVSIAHYHARENQRDRIELDPLPALQWFVSELMADIEAGRAVALRVAAVACTMRIVTQRQAAKLAGVHRSRLQRAIRAVHDGIGPVVKKFPARTKEFRAPTRKR